MDAEDFALFREHGAEPDPATAKSVEEHFANQGFCCTHVSEPAPHEQIFVNVRLHICPPSELRPFVTMFTSGMSDRAQPVPEENEDCRFSELMMVFRSDWPCPGRSSSQGSTIDVGDGSPVEDP